MNLSLSERRPDDFQYQAAQIKRDAWQYAHHYPRRNAFAMTLTALATTLTPNGPSEARQRDDSGWQYDQSRKGEAIALSPKGRVGIQLTVALD